MTSSLATPIVRRAETKTGKPVRATTAATHDSSPGYRGLMGRRALAAKR
jgi:hypothetical protein